MRKPSLIAALIIIVSSIIAIASVWHDSPIVDEIPHIGAGYGYVFENSYQFNPEHPPLAKDLAGIGLLFSGLDGDASHDAFLRHSVKVNDQWDFGRDLLFNIGNDGKFLAHAAKLPVMLLFILSAVIVFIWTRKLYGPKASLIALLLFCFSPTVVAHARFVTTDVAALFGVLISTFFFVKYLESQTRKNFWWSVVGLGIAILCKFSTFLLLPFFVLLAIVWGYAHRKSILVLLGKSILIIALAFLVIVGPYYQLHAIGYPAARQQSDTAYLLAGNGHKTLANLVVSASGKPILRPFAEYGLGLLMVTQRIEGGNRIYFLGKVVNQGGPLYFPIVYAIKEPIPFLILLILAILIGLAALFRGKYSHLRHWLSENFSEVAMLLWLLIYWVFSIKSTVNIGIRHLMPIYGFTFMLVAGAITSGNLFKKVYFKVVVGILLAWYVGEFISVYPYYLTYFNEIVGGPSGGANYVTDSNLDWGQDLWRLSDWVKANNVQKINLDYFGWSDQAYYLGSAFKWIVGGQYTSKESFLKDNPGGGYIAISETYYQQSTHSDTGYLWLLDIKPEIIVGNSIIVWHITP